jgi:GTP-binding protein HflX
MAGFLAEISRETGRQVGVVLDRRGAVQYVVVGDSTRLALPRFDRVRVGRTRLAGIRLVHTHLHGEPLGVDDLSDLSLLSLDYVLAVDARAAENPLKVRGAYLVAANAEGRLWAQVGPVAVRGLDWDFGEFIQESEGEFARSARLLAGARGGERAMLAYLDDGRSGQPEWEVEELGELARSAGLEVVESVVQRRHADPRYFIGKGRLVELMGRAMQLAVDLLVFAPELTPGQVRTISDLAEVRVIDRTQLILDIFAQRARSRDGKLQVELAQHRYLLPRLMGAGRAMSRLMGGIGGRGPGETKLESDRRRIRQRISALERELKGLVRQRRERRKRREKHGVPVVSIVGYTNAGKSTLLNTLTHAEAEVEDKLFATLDPYSKRLRFPRDREIVLTDTVGFIRDLPKDLRTAFRATLEELESADLLLHVVDASSPWMEEQVEAVERLLREMGLHLVPRLCVLNKVDRLGCREGVERLAERLGGCAVSAVRRETLTGLVARMEEMLWCPALGMDIGAEGGEVHEEELRP